MEQKTIKHTYKGCFSLEISDDGKDRCQSIQFEDEALSLVFESYLDGSTRTHPHGILRNLIVSDFDVTSKQVRFNPVDLSKMINILGKFFLETGLDWPETLYNLDAYKVHINKASKQSVSILKSSYEKESDWIFGTHHTEYHISLETMGDMHIYPILHVIATPLKEVDRLLEQGEINDQTSENLNILFSTASKELDNLLNSSLRISTNVKEFIQELDNKKNILYVICQAKLGEIVEATQNYSKAAFIENPNDRVTFELADALFRIKINPDNKENFNCKYQLILLLLANVQTSLEQAETLRKRAMNNLKHGEEVSAMAQESFPVLIGLPYAASVVTVGALKKHYDLIEVGKPNEETKNLLTKIKAGEVYLYEQIVLHPKQTPISIRMDSVGNQIDIEQLERYPTLAQWFIKDAFDSLSSSNATLFTANKISVELEIEKKRQEIFKLSNELEQLSQQENTLEGEIIQRKANEEKLSKIKIENQEMQNELTLESTKLAENKKAFLTKQQENSHLGKQLNEIAKTHAENKSQAETFQKELENFQSEIKSLYERKQPLEENARALQNSCQVLESKIEELTNKINQLSTDKESKHNEVVSLKKECAALAEQCDSLDEKIAYLKNQKEIIKDPLIEEHIEKRIAKRLDQHFFNRLQNDLHYQKLVSRIDEIRQRPTTISPCVQDIQRNADKAAVLLWLKDAVEGKFVLFNKQEDSPAPLNSPETSNEVQLYTNREATFEDVYHYLTQYSVYINQSTRVQEGFFGYLPKGGVTSKKLFDSVMVLFDNEIKGRASSSPTIRRSLD